LGAVAHMRATTSTPSPTYNNGLAPGEITGECRAFHRPVSRIVCERRNRRRLVAIGMDGHRESQERSPFEQPGGHASWVVGRWRRDGWRHSLTIAGHSHLPVGELESGNHGHGIKLGGPGVAQGDPVELGSVLGEHHVEGLDPLLNRVVTGQVDEDVVRADLLGPTAWPCP
jgi:hypothetical protein